MTPPFHLSCCLATSLDGKIADAPGRAPNFTSRFDRAKLFRLRAEADALLIGAGTVRQELLPPLVRDEDRVSERRAAGKPDHPAAVIVSRSLNLPLDTSYFQQPSQQLFILTAQADDLQRAELDPLPVSLIETGPDFSFQRGLQQLAEAGLPKILAEGGGTLIRALLAEDLVDRFYLTLAPTFLGGRDTPGLVNGDALTPPPRFNLAELKNHKGELHLVYERVSS